MENYIHQLAAPFECACNGEMETINKISISPPTYSNLKDCYPLKQFYLRAFDAVQQKELKKIQDLSESDLEKLRESAEESEGKASDETKRQFVVNTLYASEDNIHIAVSHMVSILKVSGYINDKELIIDEVLKKISMKDMDAMMGAYIFDFLEVLD